MKNEPVADFFAALPHPLKPALRATCKGILSASPKVSEGFKWNAPSYYIGDEKYFATANIHGNEKTGAAVLVVLHRGAKFKAGRVRTEDPSGLLDWLSPDRCAVRFKDAAEVKKKMPALQAVVRQWISQL